MIDECKDCDFINVYTCNECEPGFFLMTFYGTEKGKNYHACWKRMWLYLALLSLLYCPCLYCLCCYMLYKKANRVIRGPDVGGGVEVQKKAPSSGDAAPNVNYNGVPNAPQATAPNINMAGGGGV
jgi:hypothetical protein